MENDCQVIVNDGMRRHGNKKHGNRCYIMIGVIVTVVVLVAVVATVTALLVDFQAKSESAPINERISHSCNESCLYTLVESIPVNLTYPGYNGTAHHPTVYDGWVSLLEMATESIDIASSYWSLRNVDTKTRDPSASQGEDIYRRLLEAGTKRKIRIRVAQTKPSYGQPSWDTIDLHKAGALEYRSLDFARLVGAGILHTKMWLVDNKHFYVGSANLDWRSLMQVKELGSITYNCSCLASDMAKIFNAYWYLGTSNTSVPQTWPDSYNTGLNRDTPLGVRFNGTDTLTYLASSPPQFCPKGRTADIDAVLSVIRNAKEFINIAVMDYFPATIYRKHNIFWPVIEDALKNASFNNIKIRIMGSWWKHSRPSIAYYLQSLHYFDNTHFDVRLFQVPTYGNQSDIPYSRVNHNKYMVTDKQAYIGTSNWSGDYFMSTGGIGHVTSQNGTDATTIHKQLLQIFQRDWYSSYSHNVTDFLEPVLL